MGTEKKRTTGNGSNRNRHPSAGKKRRRKKRGRMTLNQFILLTAVIIGLILVLIINGIMRSRYLKVEQINDEYVLGTNFNINEFIEPVNSKAVLEFDSESFKPEELGSYKVKYTIKCGKLKKKRKVTIEVVDMDFPDIVGPDNLGFFVGEEINLLDYYTVQDAQPDLAKSLTIDKIPDSSETGYTECTLRVTDWSNHSSSKEIAITVYDFKGDMKNAALAVREYNKENGYAVSDSGVMVYYPDEQEENSYVLINDTELYKIQSGVCEKAEDDAELIQTVLQDGVWVEIGNLDYFNYNK